MSDINNTKYYPVCKDCGVVSIPKIGFQWEVGEDGIRYYRRIAECFTCSRCGRIVIDESGKLLHGPWRLN